MGRTYVRRRVTAAVVLVACLLVGPAASVFGASPGAGSQRYVVRPGDTLWAIASRAEPKGADPRPLIDQMEALNHLQDGRIEPGQILLVPAT